MLLQIKAPWGPFPACRLSVNSLTIFLGGDRGGMGWLLRTIFFLTHLRSLMQILWERETEDESQIMNEPLAVQNRLATQALEALMVGQSFHLKVSTTLCWGGTEIQLDSGQVSILSLPTGPVSLFFPKERIITGIIRNPLARASMGFCMELLHSSKLFLAPESPPQVRIVELPELSLDPEEQITEVTRLAEWVNRGHTVILSTNSLTVVQAFNNLIQASRLPPQELRGLPWKRHRIPIRKMSAFHLQEGKTPESLVGAEGFISEHPLGRVSEDLSDQLNRIGRWVATMAVPGAMRDLNQIKSER